MSKDMDDSLGFVTLLFARNLAEAEFYKTLLDEHEIPVLIEDENTESMGLPDLARGVPVMVPEEQMEIAQDIIEQRSSLDDDYEDELEDEDEDEDEFEDMEVLDLEDSDIGEEDDDEEDDEVDDDEVLY